MRSGFTGLRRVLPQATAAISGWGNIMSTIKRRRPAATELAASSRLPDATHQVLTTQSGWIECRYAGPDELVIRGTVTGSAYLLRPGSEVTIHVEDWPVVKETVLLQGL
jgi:hypothetical protein